ncbi:MAG TPA: four helix bundle protein [Tepidiformaceae bacterium]|nr:four helix bundle protein [Tepidiformaceae bacterium]
MKIERFEDSLAWQRARALNKSLYEVIRSAPCSGDREFCAQLRRASLSVMNNIAEGFERHGLRDQMNFLTISKGSAGEVRSMLYAAFDLGYIDEARFASLKGVAEEVSRLLSSWRGALGRQLRGGVLQEEPLEWDPPAEAQYDGADALD